MEIQEMKKNRFTIVLFLSLLTSILILSNIQAQTRVLENFERYENTEALAKNWRIFGYASSDFALVVDSTEKVAPGGSKYFKYTYNATTSTWGGVAERIITDATFYPLDISAAKAGLQFYLKGDGTNNYIRFRYYEYFDEAGTVDARWRSQPISLKDTTWHIVRVPFVLDSSDTYGLHLWYTNGPALQTEEEMQRSLKKITRFQINLEYPDVSDLTSHNIYFDDFRVVDFMAPNGEGDIKIADFEEYTNSAEFKTQWQGFGYGTLDYELGRDAESPEGYKNAVWVIQPEERTTWGMAFRSRTATFKIPDLSTISDNGGIKFLMKGDGTDDQFVFRFTDTQTNYWGSYWISLQDTNWHWVTVPFIVDSLKGFRWLGDSPLGTYWTRDIGTKEMFRASLNKIIEIRLDKRKPLHDDVKRLLRFDAFYAINELPPLPPRGVDDFETYSDLGSLTASWNQFGAGSVSLNLSTSDFVSGAQAMSISYNGSLGYTAVRKRNIIPGLDFSELKAGMQFWLKGDGSNNQIIMRLMSGDEMWESQPFKLDNTGWQHKGVPFKVDSLNGFRYMGSDPNNPVWTDLATDVQLNGDLANIDQIRFYVRDPEAVNEVKTIVIDKIEGVDRFSDDVIITSVNENYNSISDLSFKLQQNYPNPFNPTTTIQYSIKNDGMVSLKVYNIIGQEVVSLVNGFKKAGYHQVNFDASKLASGVYIYQIQSGSFVSAKKMLLMK